MPVLLPAISPRVRGKTTFSVNSAFLLAKENFHAS